MGNIAAISGVLNVPRFKPLKRGVKGKSTKATLYNGATSQRNFDDQKIIDVEFDELLENAAYGDGPKGYKGQMFPNFMFKRVFVDYYV